MDLKNIFTKICNSEARMMPQQLEALTKILSSIARPHVRDSQLPATPPPEHQTPPISRTECLSGNTGLL